MKAKPLWVMAAAAGIAAATALCVQYGTPLGRTATHLFELATDREQLQALLTTMGWAAPAVFVLFQVLQVVLAPFPGEASGFVGGYLFGTLFGFVYSTVGLTIGSWINFSIGRYLGRRYVRKRIPRSQLDRFDILVKHRGLPVVFLLFLLPGFPKDYLCLFLGLFPISGKIFLLMAAVGRMPGTLMLSLQGAALFERMYGVFAGILGICLILAVVVFCLRDRLYAWGEVSAQERRKTRCSDDR